jgi:transporter family-2 protein
MNTLLFAALLALLAGVAIGFQNPITSLIGQRVGLLGAAFSVHLAGTVAAGILLVALPATRVGEWRAVPWLAAAAGLLGVTLLTSVSYTIPRIGLAATVGMLLTAQLAIAAWLDHYGYLGVAVRSFDLGRLAGLVLLIAGAWLVLRR